MGHSLHNISVCGGVLLFTGGGRSTKSTYLYTQLFMSSVLDDPHKSCKWKLRRTLLLYISPPGVFMIIGCNSTGKTSHICPRGNKIVTRLTLFLYLFTILEIIEENFGVAREAKFTYCSMISALYLTSNINSHIIPSKFSLNIQLHLK